MQTDRLQVLLQLSRLGSMRAVAEELGSTTSTVSQQVAALAREAGAALVEPDGRRVRLTPAGRRLADHAVTILAAVDAALLDLAPAPGRTARCGSPASPPPYAGRCCRRSCTCGRPSPTCGWSCSSTSRTRRTPCSPPTTSTSP